MIGWFFAGKRAEGIIRRGCAKALTVAVAAVLAGCASLGGLSKDSPAAEKESAVAERAKARWQALIKRNYQEAYGFFSPASKDTTSLAVYQAKLKNRPIPDNYAVYIRTPLTVEVKAGQTTYDLQLTRKQ